MSKIILYQVKGMITYVHDYMYTYMYVTCNNTCIYKHTSTILNWLINKSNWLKIKLPFKDRFLFEVMIHTIFTIMIATDVSKTYFNSILDFFQTFFNLHSQNLFSQICTCLVLDNIRNTYTHVCTYKLYM